MMNQQTEDQDDLAKLIRHTMEQIPVPPVANPAATVQRLIAEAERRADKSRPGDPVSAVRAALAEAESLPPYDRPATVGETARWVKVRLYGHDPLSPEHMTAFLLAYAAVERRRRQEVVVAPDGSTVHALADTDTEGGPPPRDREIDALLAADRAIGELYLLRHFAGQTQAVLAALTGQAVDAVERALAAAAAWLGEESKFATTGASLA